MLEKMYLENLEETRAFRPQGEHATGVQSKKLDFPFYLRALRKKKWPIAFFTGLMTAIAIYYAQTATPVYAANATLLLESQKANIISIEDLVSSEQESLDYFGTQYAILKSRALAERVVSHLETNENISRTQFTQILSRSNSNPLIDTLSQAVGLGKSDSDDTSAATDDQSASSTDTTEEMLKDGSVGLSKKRQKDTEFDEILKQFRKSLSVSPVPKTKLVTIKYESTDPEFSALAANTVANQYIESVLEQRKELKNTASEWMDGRIAQLKVKLDESEDALLSFKRANGLIDFNGNVGRLNEQEILLVSSDLTAARNELSNTRDLYNKIQSYKASTPSLLETLPFVQNDILIRQVNSDLGQAQRDIVELQNRYGPRHPAVIDVVSRMASLRSTLNGHIERAVATYENDYQLLQQRVASLESSLLRGKENSQLLGQQKITLDALEREVTANRDQYNRLFDRITETRTADGLDEANAVVSETAWVQTQPIKPNKLLIVGLALIGSLVLAAAVAFLIEFLDDTVNSTEDVERRLKTRLLGVLPLVKTKSPESRKTLPLTPSEVVAASETYSEAVNTCRTALTISSERNLQVLLVTSSVPDEGKSTIALNLANSFGQLERTLLIDCDLRRPSIAKALDMPIDTIGLSSFMLHKSSSNDCIQRNVLNSFDCITSGPIPEQPLEMLSSAKFAKALELLRKHYDKIIIDCAPTHVVSDSLVLSRLADGVLYVVKPQHTSIKLVNSGLSRLKKASGSVLGVCISQVDIEKSRSYAGMDFHGFGVDYQNGYGEYYRFGGNPNKHLKAKLLT